MITIVGKNNRTKRSKMGLVRFLCLKLTTYQTQQTGLVRLCHKYLTRQKHILNASDCGYWESVPTYQYYRGGAWFSRTSTRGSEVWMN